MTKALFPVRPSPRLTVLVAIFVVGLLGMWMLMRAGDSDQQVMSISVAKNPGPIVGGPDGNLWVGHAIGCCSSGSVTSIDPRSGEVVATISTDEPVRSLAAAGRELWASSGAERTLTRITEGDDPTNVRFPGTHGDPGRLDLDGGILWVGMEPLESLVSDNPALQRRLDRRAARASGTVAMFDPDPAGVIRYIEVPNAPLQDFAVEDQTILAISSERRRIYAIATDTGVGSGELLWSLRLPGVPVAIERDTDTAWVALSDGTISLIDTVKRRITDSVRLADVVTDMAVGDDYVWALLGNNAAVAAVARSGHGVSHVVGVEPGASAIAWASGYAWVSNTKTSSVTRISPTAVR